MIAIEARDVRVTSGLRFKDCTDMHALWQTQQARMTMANATLESPEAMVDLLDSLSKLAGSA